MKKMMVSQPMAGKTEEEIIATRNRAIEYAEKNGLEFVNTKFTDAWYSDSRMEERGVVNVPLCFLAKSLESMSKCHIAYFAVGWQDARGCKAEHDIAKAYGMEIVYGEPIELTDVVRGLYRCSCGAPIKSLVVKNCEDDTTSVVKGLYRCYCTVCGKVSAEADTEEKAEDEWNQMHRLV